MDKIIIYGSGNMGRGVWGLLKDKCRIVCFLDGNPDLRGKTVFDIPIYHPDDIGTALTTGEPIVLLAMAASPFSEMKKLLVQKGFQRIFPAGDYVAELFPEQIIANIWSCTGTEQEPVFSDERSNTDYHMAHRWFSLREDEHMDFDRDKYFPEFMRKYISQSKIMLETATLDGGFIDRFLQISPGGTVYSHLLTPETVPINELQDKYSHLPVTFFPFEASETDGTLTCQRFGMMRPFSCTEKYTVQAQRIDTTMKNIPFDYLRCYSMSEALPILRGGESSIIKYRPVISVNISHYKTDFFEVHNYLSSVCTNYAFYFRLHSYQGNDGLLYAVPCEKMAI